MKTKKLTFEVTYTKANGQVGTILVKADNANHAIGNAKGLCATGSDFRDAVVTDKKYIKPTKQGFAGFN